MEFRFRGEEYYRFLVVKVYCCRIDRVIISTKNELHELINNANYTSGGTIDYGEFICSMCDSDRVAVRSSTRREGCISMFFLTCTRKKTKYGFFLARITLKKNMRWNQKIIKNFIIYHIFKNCVFFIINKILKYWSVKEKNKFSYIYFVNL